MTDHFILQWHITDRCNLNCTHCYQVNQSGSEVSFNHLQKIFEQFTDFIDYFSLKNSRPIRAHINFTGGEPFLRKDFFDLLELLHKHKKTASFAVLTNGTLIDDSIASRLKDLQPRFIQVSLDGNETTHDEIRGAGSYRKTLSALKKLSVHKIRTVVSFTAHRKNFLEFEDVAEVSERYNASGVWADRLIPLGTGSKAGILTP